MTEVTTANRADLEVAIIENDLIDLFGGFDAIIAAETEVLRDKLIKWVIEGNEA